MQSVSFHTEDKRQILGGVTVKQILLVGRSGCLLICQQDGTKTTTQISTKPGLLGTHLSPEQTPLTFGVDPDARYDVFQHDLFISQGIMHGTLGGQAQKRTFRPWRRYALYYRLEKCVYISL